LVGRHDPGEQVKLRISRGGKQRDVAATLGTREMAGHRVMRFNTLNQMGGPLSERRDGFPYVLEHDSVLRPNECGGPLVDLTGEAVGVNIARAGRVNSYAIPAATVQELIVALKSGRHAPDAELARATSPADGTARPDAAQRAEHIKRLEQESQRLNRQLEQLMRQLDQLRDE